jgi:hypothetical protein
MADLQALADKVVISNATGNEALFLAAVRDLLVGVRALKAASPAPQKARPTQEQRHAVKEGERNAAADTYFKARHPMLDTAHNRRIFEAGFDRGYDAAASASTEAAGALPPWWGRFIHEITLQPEETVHADLAGVLEVCVLDAIASAPVAAQPVAGADLLATLFRNVEGVNRDQPGFHHASGWNDALRRAMDVLRANAPVAAQAPQEGER